MTEFYLSRQNYLSYLPKIRNLIQASHFIAAITGAGISVASGIPLLRESIEGVELSRFFKPDLFAQNPSRYYAVYREVLKRWREAKPNAAHQMLAEAGVWVITQNVDGLHRDADTSHLIELHGNLRELRCIHCNLIFPSKMVNESAVPHCPECNAILHPGITLEGEEVRHFSRGLDWVGRAELILVIGTKLKMHPVQEYVEQAVDKHTDCLFINESGEIIVPKLFE